MKYGLTTTCGIFTVTSCIATFVAAVLHSVAFGTRRWIVSVEESPFHGIGFHEACFDMCRTPYCPAADDSIEVYLDGCAWLFDWYFQEVWWWLIPDWFMLCRILSIINVPFIFINFIILAVCSSLAFKGRYTTEDDRTEKLAKVLQIMLFIVAALTLTTILINMVLMSTMYTHGFERDWMPMPEKNAFGWSFWLEVTTTILLTGAFLCAIYAAIVKTLWLHSDTDPRYAEDMMTGRPTPSPAPAPAPTALGHALRGLPANRTV